MSSHSALAIGHDPDKPTSLWNHNHTFDERLRCPCGKTWTQQVSSPSLCKLDVRGVNKSSVPHSRKRS
jgi:hypothetical protein